MRLFSIIETLFFISLGITIILVALLVYHFKQRLSALENKYESLFDIVSGIVKQMSNIQSQQQMVPQMTDLFGGMYPQQWVGPEHLGNMNVSNEYPEQLSSIEHKQYNIPQVYNPINYTIEEDSDEDEEDDESMDDEDSEYDEEDSDEEEPGEEEDYDDNEEESKIIVSDDEHNSQQDVKIINLHMDEPSIHIEDFNITPLSLEEPDDIYDLPAQDVQMNYLL